jgi:hypothetical protein
MINDFPEASQSCRIAKLLARTRMSEARGRANAAQRYGEIRTRDTGRHQRSSETHDVFAELIRRDRQGIPSNVSNQPVNGSPIALPYASFQPAESLAFITRPNWRRDCCYCR